MPLLKTCQTCFHAKIRCVKSQDSGVCDRCLRLNKSCVFHPARRSVVPPGRTGRLNAGLSSRRTSRSPKSQHPASTSPASLGSLFNQETSFNPFQRGLLSVETGKDLLDGFTTKMTIHFPFVTLPKPLNVADFAENRPCLCLAALAAAASREFQLQRTLGRLFIDMVALRLAKGPVHSLDLLQSLLVHIAWAHYQPRPQRYTQHLHLATSIVCDMRIDQPRKPRAWTVHGMKDKTESDWGHDEKRALAGAFYLSSSSSILLHKSRYFAYSSHLDACCDDITMRPQYPTDKHLPFIVRLQRLVEEVDDAVNSGRKQTTSETFMFEMQKLKTRYAEIKASMPFALSESPLILSQTSLLELLLSQATPNGTLFGLDKFQHVESMAENNTVLLDWLSVSMSAARSLLSVVLVLPSGEEQAVSNIEWICLYCGLSLAVRLDLMAGDRGVPEVAHRLRVFLDMPNTLRQVVMRLESASGSEVDATGDRDAFHHLANRARRLEEWYLNCYNRTEPFDTQTQGETVQLNGPNLVLNMSSIDSDATLLGQAEAADHQVQGWNHSFNFGGTSDLDLGTFLFADPMGFPMDFEE